MCPPPKTWDLFSIYCSVPHEVGATCPDLGSQGLWERGWGPCPSGRSSSPWLRRYAGPTPGLGPRFPLTSLAGLSREQWAWTWADHPPSLAGSQGATRKYKVWMRHRYQSCCNRLAELLTHPSFQVKVSVGVPGLRVPCTLTWSISTHRRDQGCAMGTCLSALAFFVGWFSGGWFRPVS